MNCLNNNLTHFVWYLEKEKRYRVEWAPNASLRPLIYFGKQPKTAIACKKFFCKEINKNLKKK